MNAATEIGETTKITETETTGITAAMAGTPRQIGKSFMTMLNAHFIFELIYANHQVF